MKSDRSGGPGAGRWTLFDGWAADWQLSRGAIVAMVLGPGIVAITGIGSGLFGKAAYKWVTGEDGAAETLQVLFYLGAFGLCTLVTRELWRESKRFIALLYALVAVGLFFLIGEELSWGQRIFGWGTPEALREVNKQEETNLHNIHGIGAAFKWIQLLVGAYGGLLPLVLLRDRWLGRLREFAAFVVPPISVGLYFAPMAVWRLYRNTFEPPRELYFAIAEYNEVMELILAMGFFLFMLYQLRRLRARRPGSAVRRGESLASLIESGSRLWLDSVDPDRVSEARALGISGATSNPILIADVIRSGRCDARIADLVRQNLDDEEIAWTLTDEIVVAAQRAFHPVWKATRGNDGWVSFELDPLLEDKELGPRHAERVARYIDLGRRWSRDRPNRLIKVPATDAGMDALEDLAAAGVPLNVTLIFTPRQHRVARDAVWRGIQRAVASGGRRGPGATGLTPGYKSVYSLFVSRLDVYAERHVRDLSIDARRWVGILTAKQIWAENCEFWADKGLPLDQEIVFASTGVKSPDDVPDRYVAALAGSDVQTNPPATQDWIATRDRVYESRIRELPATEIRDEIRRKVDMEQLERTLIEEGTARFAEPHRALLTAIAHKRRTLLD